MLDAHGYIIAQSPYSNTSLLVDIISREYGRFKAIVKGARNNHKKHIHYFTLYQMQVYGKSNLKTLGKVEADQSFYLMGDSLFAGLYINELLYYLLQDLETEVVIELYQSCLQGLAEDQILVSLRLFEHYLLEQLGFGVNLLETSDGERVDAQKSYIFDTVNGGLFCSDWGVKGAILIGMHKRQKQYLTSKQCKIFMRQRIDHALGGRKLNSRKLFVK